MLFVEEFTVDLDYLDNMMSYIKEALGVIDDLEAPYLKSLKVYYSTDDSREFRVYYGIDRRKDIESLIKEFNHIL